MNDARRMQLFILLWLIAIHSLCVGVALIVLPTSALETFGYEGYSGRFFQVQGGVFHLIMVVFYVLAARELGRSSMLIFATIGIKTVATVFLLSFFWLVESNPVILWSGLADGGMGLAVFILHRRYQHGEVL